MRMRTLQDNNTTTNQANLPIPTRKWHGRTPIPISSMSLAQSLEDGIQKQCCHIVLGNKATREGVLADPSLVFAAFATIGSPGLDPGHTKKRICYPEHCQEAICGHFPGQKPSSGPRNEIALWLA